MSDKVVKNKDSDVIADKSNFLLQRISSKKNKKELENAILASNILFGKSTSDDLKKLDSETFLAVFEGVPQYNISKEELNTDIFTLLVEKTSIFNSKGEARRMISSNAVSFNKEKISSDFNSSDISLINEQYLLVQKGKKNYFVIKVS